MATAPSPPLLNLPVLNAATEANDDVTVRRLLASVPASPDTAAALTAGPLPIAVRSGSLMCGLALCDAGADMASATIDGKSMAAVALDNANAGALVVAVALGSDPASVDTTDRPEWSRLVAHAADPTIAAAALCLVRGDSVPGVAHDDRFVLLDPEASPTDVSWVLRQIRRAAHAHESRCSPPRLSLRSCLLVAVLSALFMGGLITLVTIASLTTQYFPSWTADVEDFMIDSEVENLIRLAAEKALFIDTALSVTRTSTLVLSGLAARLMDGVITSSAPHTMYSVLGPSTAVPGLDPASSISYETGGWYACSTDPTHLGDCSGVADFASLPGPTQADLLAGKPLEVYHIALHRAGLSIPVGGSSGIGIQANGGMLLYPFISQPLLGSFRVACDPASNVTKVGYDPRCRPWYHDAVALGRSVSVSFSAPYVFPTKTFGVTASAPTYSTTSPSTLLGVAIIDFPIDHMRDAAVAAPILREGYGFILAADGAVVAHPRQVAGELVSIYVLELGSGASAASVNELCTKVVEPMTRQETRSTSFTKRGERWYIAFQPIELTGYSLAVLVPETDVRKPSLDAQDEINSFIAVEMVLGVVIFIAIMGVAIVVSSQLSKNIARPVQHLLTATRAINNGDFSMLNPVQGVHTDLAEMQALKTCFNDMYEVIKVTNSAVTRGNCEEAIQSYRRHLAVFQKTGNVKVVGLLHNNLGVAHFFNGDIESAVRSLDAAIAAVRELLNVTPSGDLAVTGLEGTLASRLRNLCVVASESDSEFLLRKAVHAAHQSAELDRLYPSDHSRVARTIDALLLKTTAMTKLWSLTVMMPAALEPSLSEAERLSVGLTTPDAVLVQQRVMLARAKYELVVGHRREGMRLLAALLEMGSSLDVASATEAARTMVSEDATLEPFLAPVLCLTPESASRPPLDVVLAVDASESMDKALAGGGGGGGGGGEEPGVEEEAAAAAAAASPTRMQVAQRNILRLLKTTFRAGDRVWVVPFADDCPVSLHAADASANAADVERVVHSIQPHGSTRLWDALLAGFHVLIGEGAGGGGGAGARSAGSGAGSGSGGAGTGLTTSSASVAGAGAGAVTGGRDNGPRRRRWLVVLTGGEDTASKAKLADVVAARGKTAATMVVIGLGVAPQHQVALNDLVSHHPEDMYLNAGTHTPEDLGQAFSAAAGQQMVPTGLTMEDF